MRHSNCLAAADDATAEQMLLGGFKVACEGYLPWSPRPAAELVIVRISVPIPRQQSLPVDFGFMT